MVCSLNFTDADPRPSSDVQGTFESSISNVIVVDGLTADYSNSTDPGGELDLAAKQAKPKIIWKAYIQTPLRLTEEDALPIARPEFYGLQAPSTSLPRTMDKTIREYRFMLPHLVDDQELRGRSDSKTSRFTTGARTIVSAINKARRIQKYLKTIPTGLLQFPPLQRSPQFENFIKGRAAKTEKSVKEPPTISNDYFYDNKINSGGDNSGKKQAITESEKASSESEFVRYSEARTSIDSLQSKLRRISLFKKSLSKINVTFPISPFSSNVRRSMAILQTLRNERIQSGCTDMVQGNLVHLNDQRLNELETTPEQEKKKSIALSVRRLLAKSQRMNLPSNFRPVVVDLDGMLPGLEILEAKIREYDLKLPIACGNAEELRNLYTVTILKEHNLKDLLTSSRLDALPNSLRQIVRMGSLYNQKERGEKTVAEQKALDHHLQYCMINEPKVDTALADVESLWIEAKVFTTELFTNWMTKMQLTKSHERLSVSEFEMQLKRVSKAVRANVSVPTSQARSNLSVILATSVAFPKHQYVLWNRVGDWLESLLAGLFSRERTVREETCYIIAYVFTEPILVEGVRHCSTYDVGYDATSAVLNAMQLSPNSFMHFFCLLALMIEGCPMFSILNAIMDLGPMSNLPLLNHLWPRLLYYALKFWNGKQFLRDRLILKTLNESIERAYVKGISKKNAKLAQIQLSKRFKVLTKPTTIWLDEWKMFQSG